MTEREQIIEGLLDVVADLSPFAGDHEDWKKVHRAIKYLKEREPVKPIKTLDGNGHLWRDCGKCGGVLPKDARYCPTCGRRVEWDG